MAPAAGVWKEGRQGAASLCYHHLDDARLDLVAAHHARVGIRATLVHERSSVWQHELSARNWDLVPDDDEPPTDEDQAPMAYGQIIIADVTFPKRCMNANYHVEEQPGCIAQPCHGTTGTLPARNLPTILDAACMAIDTVVRQQAWAIWLVDATVFDALGTSAHAVLLDWLGEHHARIWCAPIRDIAAY